jgi:hypothetical protein
MPSCPVRLMPPASDQSPSAFLFVQLRRLEARDISHANQKGKERLNGCPVLCLSPLGEPPPLFVVQLQGLEAHVISQTDQEGKKHAFMSGSPYATRL